MSLPLNNNLQQIFLHMLNFVILAAGLYFLLYKPVKAFMDKRAAYYKDMDKEANAHLESAKASEQALQGRIKELDAELNEKRSEANKEINELRTREIQKAQEEAAKIRSDAKQAAEREKAAILADAKNEIVEFAEKAAEQLLAKSASESFDDFLNAAERGGVDAE